MLFIVLALVITIFTIVKLKRKKEYGSWIVYNLSAIFWLTLIGIIWIAMH